MARIHSIVTVTQGGILYNDVAEIVRWVDFQECREHHDFYMPNTACDDGRCIGRCSFLNPFLPYVEFFTIPVARLEFDEPLDLHHLLKQMAKFGWKVYHID